MYAYCSRILWEVMSWYSMELANKDVSESQVLMVRCLHVDSNHRLLKKNHTSAVFMDPPAVIV